jgi:hypothetical protein
MLLLQNEKIDRIVGHWRRYLLASVVVILVVIALPMRLKTGGFTGFMLFSLGIYAMALRKWRSEPGIWMLAAFLVAVLVPICATFEFWHWQSVFAKKPNWFAWDEIRRSLDALVALHLLFECVRLAMSVAIKNWRYTRTKGSLSASDAAASAGGATSESHHRAWLP